MLKILAANPEVRVESPKYKLFLAMEAAELGEPGALAALVELKLSEHPQFRDLPGACKLMETADIGGDQALATLLARCRGS